MKIMDNEFIKNITEEESMRIIIVGLGKVGQTLAAELSEEDNDITVIDNRESVVQDFANQYDLMGVVGMFIFIPLVSVLYAYFRSIVYRRIKKREINVDDKQVPDDVVPLESAGRRLFAMKSKVEKTDSKKQNKEM